MPVKINPRDEQCQPYPSKNRIREQPRSVPVVSIPFIRMEREPRHVKKRISFTIIIENIMINTVVNTVIETDAFNVIHDDVIRKNIINGIIDLYAAIVV